VGSCDSSSIDEIYRKLVEPIVPGGINLHLVGIFRPKGALPDLSNTDIESRFPGIPLKWVTLDDLSYGAAVLMDCEPGTSPDTMLSSFHGLGTRQHTLGITLADGNTVTVSYDFLAVPLKWIFMFTTCRDHQTTATVRLCRGTKLCAKVTLQGMAPRPRGQGMIKVFVNASRHDNTAVSIEEIGTSLKIINTLGTALQLFKPYKNVIEVGEESTGAQIGMSLGKDGIIGELPE
jgi:hypothetical protein